MDLLAGEGIGMSCTLVVVVVLCCVVVVCLCYYRDSFTVVVSDVLFW